jgi:hypothetical protein
MSPTPPFPDPDELDRAASDLVDGLADGADPSLGPAEQVDLAGRVDRLHRVTEALGQEIQQPETSVRDEQIARAVARGQAQVARALAPATPLRPIRNDQATLGRRRVRTVLAAAAALVALVAGILVVQRVAHDRGSRTTRAAIATAPTAQATAGGPEAAGPAGTGTPFEQLPDLGSATDAGQLGALVTGRLALEGPAIAGQTPSSTASVAGPGASPTPDASGASAPSCEASIRAAHRDLGGLGLAARASLAGQPVEVLVFEPTATGGRARLFAASPTTCTVLVDRPA